MSRRTPATAARAGALRALAILLALPLAARAAPLAVVDDTGATVALAQPARRIASLSPHLTEQLFAIGAGPQIVATSDFADYPAAARSIPRVARAGAIDIERLAAARPDLVAVWGSGYGPSLVAALRRLSIPLFVSEPTTLDAIATTMTRLGTLSGHDAEAAAAATAFRTRLARLRARYAGRPEVRVFYQAWNQPLITVGGHQVISEALRACGARNIFERLDPPAPQVAVEAVVAADPDLIVASEPGGVDHGALAAWHALPQLRAVRGGHLETLDADRLDRQAPRMLDEIERLCEAIDRVRPAPPAAQPPASR